MALCPRTLALGVTLTWCIVVLHGLYMWFGHMWLWDVPAVDWTCQQMVSFEVVDVAEISDWMVHVV